MKLKPLNWVKQPDYLQHAERYYCYVMGITLGVILDPDSTYTASLSGIVGQRPEYQKGFETAAQAKHYAEHTLLTREIKRYFYDE